MKNIIVEKHEVGMGKPCYIVAELSANHGQCYDRAAELVHAAKEAGADAIKLQTYLPSTITIDCDSDIFRIHGTIWEGDNLYRLYEKAFTPWDWQPKLKRIADDLGLDCFSSPFDPTAVDFLENMGVPAHKIASFEVVDIPLVRRIALTGKPIIMSTGMATLDEIAEAVQTIRETGNDQIVLLKCTSSYPAPPEEMNLRTIPDLSARFDVPVGLSDHTLGSAVAVTAVALGACMIEKHFTLARADGGPDAEFSMEPHEFKDMVQAIRIAEKALGRINYEFTEHEAASRVYRRSLFVVKNVKAGETFTPENVRSIRPGHGLAPKYTDEVIGRQAACDITAGTPLRRDLLG